MNIKILCFFISPHVFRPKKDAKEMTFYLFTIILLTLFTLGVTSAIKVTPFDGVTLVGL